MKYPKDSYYVIVEGTTPLELEQSLNAFIISRSWFILIGGLCIRKTNDPAIVYYYQALMCVKK